MVGLARKGLVCEGREAGAVVKAESRRFMTLPVRSDSAVVCKLFCPTVGVHATMCTTMPRHFTLEPSTVCIFAPRSPLPYTTHSLQYDPSASPMPDAPELNTISAVASRSVYMAYKGLDHSTLHFNLQSGSLVVYHEANWTPKSARIVDTRQLSL